MIRDSANFSRVYIGRVTFSSLPVSIVGSGLISSHIFQARLDYRDSLFRVLLRWEHVPESQCLISCACDQRLAIRTCCQVQHSVGVSGQGCHSLHARVLPNVDLVLTIAVGGNELVHILGEHQVAHLTAGLNGLERFKLQGVPELDGPVLGATTGSEQALFVRGPCDRLDCGLVLVKLLQWCGTTPGAPDE